MTYTAHLIPPDPLPKRASLYPGNGVIVIVRQFGEEFQYVYQNRDDELQDIEAWADLLRVISEQHGPPDQGRHAAHRLYIRVAPGDKYAQDTLDGDAAKG